VRHLFTGATLAALIAAATAVPVVAAHGATAPTQDRGNQISSEQAKADQSGRALGLGTGEKLVVTDVITDADGSSHVRYARTFNGLRVIGGDLVSHRDQSGAVKDVTWNASGKVAVRRASSSTTRRSPQADPGQQQGGLRFAPGDRPVVWPTWCGRSGGPERPR